MEMRPVGDYKIEPEALGPIEDRPLAETVRGSSPGDLFPGASRFLARRHQDRRRQQWAVAQPVAAKLMQPGERVLYVAHGIEVPGLLHQLVLGAMAPAFHQVLLVLTDRRLIEVLLDFRGRRPGTRLRSFPWDRVRDLSQRWGRIALTPASGRKIAWRLPVRGDRKVLDLILARLKTRLLTEGAARAEAAGPLPVRHCPQCAGSLPERPASCPACRSSFVSSRLATWLSIAFPGAGLFYAGHPFLAAADFLGEIFLFAIFVMMLTGSGPEGRIGVVIAGFIFLVMTKAESVHIGRILTARTIPETAARHARFRTVGMAGGVLSVLAIAAAFPFAGVAQARIDHDLDVAVEDGSWTGTRNVAEWDQFRDDPSARSMWESEDGLKVAVFAYPQRSGDGLQQFRASFREELKRTGQESLVEDEDVPEPFRGFHTVTRVSAADGGPLDLLQYFLYDQEANDVHQVLAAVHPEARQEGEQALRDFLTHARFIEAAPPVRP